MQHYRAPIADMQFLLHELLSIRSSHLSCYQTMDFDLLTSLLEAGAEFCQDLLLPLNQSGDKEGVQLKQGKVITPSGFKEAYHAYVQAGWGGMTCHPQYGGQGLADLFAMPMTEMICSTNLSFGITPGLTHGAYNALLHHANEEIKSLFLAKMASGEYSGVMCLTEPHCGTDLGLIRTTASPLNDDSDCYHIQGTKIFISAGDQDVSSNIIHLVLARLPDAPKGVKGISLFVVPKIMVEKDGSLGKANGVTCTSIEHKMGIHGSPTCVMQYDQAIGWLVGEKHKGLRAMFTMMNEARLYVSIQGLGLAETAYQSAVIYAKDRLQGRDLKGARYPDKAADPLLVHPDIRRMLLTMKSLNEGARAMIYETAYAVDRSKYGNTTEERQQADEFVQLVTPVLKSFITDMGFDNTNLAMQVYGGHGYVRDHGMEQLVRDARIAQIYEGANGVQALDLIGRKLPAHTGRYFRHLMHPMADFIEKYRTDPAMVDITKPLYKAMDSLQKASLWIADQGLRDPRYAAASSVEYARLFGLVWMGFMWAKMALKAYEQLAANPNQPFYQSKWSTSLFFFEKILPAHYGHLATLTGKARVVTDFNDEWF
jgi:alkylation response protein AidB-like acyl-CoA dehydrogenase